MINQNLKTAIVHDWLTTYAGSERCVESFTNIWNNADIYSLVDFLNEKDRQTILKGKNAKTSFVQKLPLANKYHRHYFPLFPLAIEQFDLSGYDLVISSSHAFAKGALTNSNQLHICYCYTPIRYAWDLTHQYFDKESFVGRIQKLILQPALHNIRTWDVVSANRVDYFVAISNYIARRIKKIYRRDAEVIYPPVDTAKFSCESHKEDFYLTASRFVPYKKIDLIAESFSKMPDKKLIIIGEGSDKEKIKAKSAKNVKMINYKEVDDLAEYMKRARAFVFAAEEDFGISVIEALSCGTPVIALNKGGTAETIVDGKYGIHFSDQTPDDIVNAVARFEKSENTFDPQILSNYAKQFDRSIFEEKIKSFIKIKSEEFFKK
ncbi:MAG: glycosyl transferase family 1 [Ignavibacteria bacterium RBG_16_35_7]|nr:MAG: glycosyl transferase family 1 [Ignavibacteria bacterium RBG_16_35_7]